MECSRPVTAPTAPFYPYAAAAAAASSPTASTAASIAANIAAAMNFLPSDPPSVASCLVAEDAPSSKRHVYDVGVKTLTGEVKRPSCSDVLRMQITTPNCLKAAATTLSQYGVTKLFLDFAPGIKIDEADLQALLELPLNLTSLRINGHGLTISGACLQNSTALTQLTSLALEELPNLNDAALQPLFLRNNALTRLSLTRCPNVTGTCIQTPSLTSLDLREMNISDASLGAVFSQAPHLQSLLLESCPHFTGRYIHATAPHALRELEQACLVDLPLFTNEGVQELLRRATRIQRLEMQECPQISQISPEGESFPSPHLIQLTLSGLDLLEPENLGRLLVQLQPTQRVAVTLTDCPSISDSPAVSLERIRLLRPLISLVIRAEDLSDGSDSSSYEADDDESVSETINGWIK